MSRVQTECSGKIAEDTSFTSPVGTIAYRYNTSDGLKPQRHSVWMKRVARMVSMHHLRRRMEGHTMGDDRNVTTRRNLEQCKHCVDEAYLVLVHNEDPRSCRDDLIQARLLIDTVLKKLPKE